MLPIQDLNPRRRFPVLTFVLIGINIAVFLWEMSLTEAGLADAFTKYAIVPANINADPFSTESLLDVIRSMFLHGGYEHIVGNMLYLYLFGDNVEDRFGWILYLVMYFAAGFGAAIAQIAIDPNSTVPMIGASGAIAGVLGSYLILYPTVKVRGIIPLGRVQQMATWPAFAVLGMWFVLQLVSGIASLGADYASGSVAFFAHVGGFIIGVVITLIFMALFPQPDKDKREAMLYQRVGEHSI